MRGRRTDLGLPSHDMSWGCVGSLGEALERSIVAPSTCRQINLWLCGQRHTGKNIYIFDKSTMAWYPPRTMAIVSKMVTVLGIAISTGGTTLLSIAHSHLPWAIWLFHWLYHTAKSTVDKVHNICSVQILVSISLYSPGNLFCLTGTTLPRRIDLLVLSLHFSSALVWLF